MSDRDKQNNPGDLIDIKSLIGDADGVDFSLDDIMAEFGHPPAPEEPGEAAYVPAGEASAPPAPDLAALMGQIDPQMIQVGMDVIRQVQSTEDRNAALLNALRPFLKEDRQARLDRALRIARTAKLVRVALGALGRKEGGERV